ncbi:restriction endonuclease subunit S [Bacillus sp. CH30_1T]|uniref:restriction endonuclease subunit S n=1 Tax=Bacillus sp. CH30_1T TaxID=2604836 RepID=UPI001CAA82F8|nr:restriction endonuclease subunit S [Bacillus sp. CH30_1T]
MKSNIPEIRFPGFSGDWKKRRLAEVAHYRNGGSFENEVVNKGKYELITLKSVDINGNLVPSKKFIDSEVSTLAKDTLVMILSEQAPGLLGKTSVIPFNNYYVLNQRVASLTPKEESDSNFLTKAINRNGKYFSSRGAGTKVQNISKPNVENFEFFIPELKEQIKIGSFLKMVDNIIYLHQQELNTLKQTKQGFLQKMFPKEGESFPEVRFDGFSGEWSRVTLDKVIQKQIKGKAQLGKFSDGEVEYLDANRLNGGAPFYSNGIQDVSADNIIILWDGSKAGTVYKGFCGVLGSTLKAYSINEKNNSDFIYQQLVHNQEKIYKHYRTPNIPHVVKDFTDVFLIYITSLEEQQKIGDFLKQLDDTIALHQRELDILKETKKAFLQKMFV